MSNQWWEGGPIFQHGSQVDASGNSVTREVRRVIAAHQTLLKGFTDRAKRLGGRFTRAPSSRKRTVLQDGTVVTTWIDFHGLVPTFVSRVFHPVMEEEVIISQIWHGFSAWEPIAITYPVWLYADSTLADYLNGVGTVAGGDNIGFLIGEYTANEDECAVFSESAPASYTDGAIEFPYFAASGIPETPQNWTGLTRLVSQAFLGANRLFNALSSADYTFGALSATTCGIQRNPDTGEFWLFRCDTTVGLIATNLVVDKKMECLNAQIASGDISGYDKQLALACVCSSLTLSKTATILELLTSTDIADVFADSAQPLFGGWHWFWQQADDAAGAVIVTNWHPDTKRRSRKCEISITWGAEGLPEATIDIGATETWGGSIVRVSDGTTTHPLDQTVNAGPADIYAWTTPDGISCLRRIYEVGASSSGYPPEFPGLCEDSYEISETVETWSGTDGWMITGGQSAETKNKVHTEYLVQTHIATRSMAGTVDSDCQFGHESMLRVLNSGFICSGSYAGYYRCSEVDEYGTASVTLCNVSAEQKIETYSDFSFSSAAVICSDGSVTVLYQETSIGEETIKTTGKDGLIYSSSDGFNGTIYYSSTPEIDTGTVVRMASGHDYACGRYLNDWTTTVEESELSITQCYYAPLVGGIITLDATDWSGLLSSSGPAPAPEGVASWGGLLAYTPTFGDWTFPDNIPSDPEPLMIKAWVGGS